MITQEYAYIEYKECQLAILETVKNNLLRSVKLVDPNIFLLLDTKAARALTINPYSLHFNRVKIFEDWSEDDFLEFIEIIVTIFSDATIKLYIPSVIMEFWAMSTENYILLYNTVVSQSGKCLAPEDLGNIVQEYLLEQKIGTHAYVQGIPGERLFMFQRKLYVLGLDNVVRLALAGPGAMLSWSPLRSVTQNNELRDYGRMAARDVWHDFLANNMQIFRKNCSWPDIIVNRIAKVSRADFATILVGTKIDIDHFTWT